MTKLFSHILALANNPQTLVVVLVDEAESLVSSRCGASIAGEPGDALRVVNSVLTSLDMLRRKPNVLVLCTSNLVSRIDSAFLDRIDLKTFLGPPPPIARYRILKGCLQELAHKGLVQAHVQAQQMGNGPSGNMDDSDEQSSSDSGDSDGALIHSNEHYGHSTANDSCCSGSLAIVVPDSPVTSKTLLRKIVLDSEGLSGRALRKLPMQAYAFQTHSQSPTMREFLEAMHATLLSQRADKEI